MVVSARANTREVFEQLRGQGFVRARVDGHVVRARRAAEARSAAQETHASRSSSTACRSKARMRSSASPNRSRPRCSSRPTASWRASSFMRRSEDAKRPGVLRRARLPDLRLPHAGARTPAVLVQQPRSGACPACDGLGRASSSSIRRASSPSASIARRRRDPRLGSHATRITSQLIRRSRRHYGFDLEDAVGRAVRRRPEGRAVRQGRGRRSSSATPTRKAAAHCDDEASLRRHHPQPRAALARNRVARRCARNSRSISARSPAPNATARGSTAPRATCSLPTAACCPEIARPRRWADASSYGF